MVMLMVITAIATRPSSTTSPPSCWWRRSRWWCATGSDSGQPYLIAEVLASNIGGAATLIGDPPNIIIGSRAGLTFNDFLVHMAPIVVVIFVAFVLLTKVLFKGSFQYNPERVEAVMALQERRAITDPKLLVRCLVVLAGVVAGFGLHSVLHLEPSIVAARGGRGDAPAVADLGLRGAGGGRVADAGVLHRTVRDGRGSGQTGVIATVGTWAIGAVGDDYFLAATSLLFGSSVLGAFFDNIPYVATMAPVVEGIVAQAPDAATGQALWWAFALGADFGGNGTAVAASANVVAIGIAARTGHPISFWQFTKYGIVVTVLSTLMAWAYVWLRYFM